MNFESNNHESLHSAMSPFTGALDTLKVLFTILDADDRPYWTMTVSPYIDVVPTDAPNAACLYTLTAEDQDPDSVITYFLRAGEPSKIKSLCGYPSGISTI